MGSSRRKYTAEYRSHAVELVRESGKPIAEVARDLGVNEGTLANWVNRSRQLRTGSVTEVIDELEDLPGPAGGTPLRIA